MFFCTYTFSFCRLQPLYFHSSGFFYLFTLHSNHMYFKCIRNVSPVIYIMSLFKSFFSSCVRIMRNGYWFNREVVNILKEPFELPFFNFIFFYDYTDALNGYVYHKSEKRGKKKYFHFFPMYLFKVFNMLFLIQHLNNQLFTFSMLLRIYVKYKNSLRLTVFYAVDVYMHFIQDNMLVLGFISTSKHHRVYKSCFYRSMYGNWRMRPNNLMVKCVPI